MKHNTETRDHTTKVYSNSAENTFLKDFCDRRGLKLGPFLRNAGMTIAAYELQSRNDRRRSGRSEGPAEGLGKALHLPSRSRFVGQRMSFRS